MGSVPCLLYAIGLVVGISQAPQGGVTGDTPHWRPPCPECDQVVERVLRLLPKRPEAIVVVDADRSGQVLKKNLEHVEGFVTTGGHTVYLTKQSAIMQKALAGPGIWDYALAITVWHEMAHIEGADEREAQLREEELWKEFILERRVDSYRGQNYLALLQKRREPQPAH